MLKDRLVAHRGDMKTYPENTLLAFNQAIELGFKYIELDIQFSKDLIPIVIHDDNLARTTGVDKAVSACDAKELFSYTALTNINDSESDDLIKFSSLEKVVEALNKYPDITLFVEIKKHILEHVDINLTVDCICKSLKNANMKIVIISFVREIIDLIKLTGTYEVGWVLTQYDQISKAIVEEMQPDYLFCNVIKVNQPSGLWIGPWKWVLYDVMDPGFAHQLLEQGVDMIETGDIVKLSESEFFANG